MDKTRKWRRVLAIMLTIVMMLQNVQSVVWAAETDSSTQETTVEKKSDSEDNKTTTDEEQTKEETADKSSEELTDSGEKNTEETAAALTSTASQSVTADTVGEVTSYYANYRLDVTNTGNAAAEGVKVEITLPIEDAAVDTSKTYTTGYTETVTDSGYRVLTWDDQGVATSETGTYMFSIQIPAGVTNLSDVNVAWYVNGSKAEAEEWVAGSDETLAANVKADDSTGSNADGNNSRENSDNNAGNDTSDNNQNTDNGNGGNNNGNSDSANDADRIPDNQASQILTYEGNGVNAKLLLVSENATFPDGFSFQVNPVSAEQTEAYVQDAQESGLEVNTGAFYDVQLLYNGVNASLTSAESMQLQVDFNSPVLTDVENVTGVEVTNGDVSTDGVSGNATSLTKTLTADSVGTVGVVALANEGDGQSGEGDKATEGNEGTDSNTTPTPVSKPVTYNGNLESDGTTVNITMTGTDLPESKDVEVTIEKVAPNDADIYNAINGAQSSTGINSSDNPLWMSEFYKVTLKNKSSDQEISLNNAKVEFSFAGKGTLSINRNSAAVYNIFEGTENSITAYTPGEENLQKDSNGAYIEKMSFENVSAQNTFGVTAYRRSPKDIDLSQENQINTSESYFEWREKDSTGDWKKIEENSKIPVDAQVRVYVSYEVKEILVKGDTLTFNLPSNFKAVTANGEIKKEDPDSGESVTIARYEIIDNKVTITGTDAFYDADGLADEVTGDIQFTGQFTGIGSGSGTEQIDFVIGGVEVKFDVEKKEEVKTNSLGISKTVEDGLGQTDKDGRQLKQFDDMLVYTITVTAPSSNEKSFDNVKVTDEVTEGLNYIENLITNWDGKGHISNGADDYNNLTDRFTKGESGFYYRRIQQDASGNQGDSNASGNSAANESSGTQDSTGTQNPWTIKMNTGGDKGLPSSFDISYIEPGETIIIKYAVKINKSIIGLDGNNKNNVSNTITNTVKVEDENKTTKATADSSITYSKEWLKKSYKIKDNTHIEYTIVANQQWLYNLNGWTFKDTLGKDEGQTYENIKVSWTDRTGTTVGNAEWKADGTGTDITEGNKTGFTVNSEKTEFSWNAKDGYYKYTFTYTVKLENPGYIDRYTNNITLSGSEDRNYSFSTSTDTGDYPGGDGYHQYEVEKKKTGITIDSAKNTTTIQWQAVISSVHEKNINVPANSVYTDTLVNESTTISQKMTESQLDAIEVTAYNSEDESVAIVSSDYYEVEPIKSGDDITGFSITFNQDMATSSYKTPITITYSTTSAENLKDIVSGTYKNTVVFKADDNHSFNGGDVYQYAFNKLLNKQADPNSYRYDATSGQKTVRWKFTVNAEQAIGMKDLEIRDTLPKGLKYLRLEGGSNLVTKTSDSSDYNPVFKIADCNGEQVEFYIVTEIEDKVDDNKGLEYYNTADLYIGKVKYGTAADTLRLNLKVLDKKATAESNGTLSYTLDINPAKEIFSPENSKATLYVIDEMGENLELYSKSFSVTADGESYNGCTVAPVEGDSTKFIIKGIPDGKHVVITYKAQAIDPSGSVTAYNKATLYCEGEKKADDEQQKNFSIQESTAGLEKGANIFIRKVDKANYQALSGAHFEFGTVEYANGAFAYTKVKDKDLITDANGLLYFSSRTVGMKLETGKLYYFKETTPPDHYRGDGTEQVFCIIDKPVANKISGVNYLRSGAFINVFNESYDAGVSVTLLGKKMVNNGTVSENQFEFTVKSVDGAPLQNIDGTEVDSLVVTNDNRGIIKFGPINFKHTDLEGNSSKTFKYEIEEKQPNGAQNNKFEGIIYDTKKYTVLITVTDDGNGNLSYACTVDGSAYSPESSIVFQNTYDSMTTLRFTGTKELVGKSLTDHMFGFEITGDGVDEIVYNTKNTSTGNSDLIEFPMITIKYEDFKDGNSRNFKYVIQEVNNGQYKDGIQYSSEIYNVVVHAELKSNREIEISSVTVQKTINGTDNGEGPKTINGTNGVYSLTGNEPTFTNTYGASGTITVSGTKILQNKSAIAENAYEFVLKPDATDADAPVRTETGSVSDKTLTATNDSNGKFQFATLHYQLEDLDGANEKTFTYKITENINGTRDVTVNGVTTKVKDGVTYDTSKKTLQVTVKNQGNGQLLVTAMLDGVPYAYTGNSSLLTFTNVFNASGKLILSGKKTLTGRTLEAKQFLFNVYDVSNSLQEKIETDQKPVAQAVNNADGNFTFEIPYTLEDIADITKLNRVYLVKEHDDGNHPGYTYDSTVYKVYVTLSEANGAITPTITDIKVNEDSVKDSLTNNVLTFHNEYSATGKFTPEVSKRVYPDTRKQELEQSKFQFKMQGVKLNDDADFPTTEEGMEALNLDNTDATTVFNKADGTVDFGSIDYVVDKTHQDTLGKYVYKISEVENSELKGYTFAKPIYAFVTVSDPGTGELDVQVSYKSTDFKQLVNATFINYYSGDGEIQFVGRKVLEGRTLEADQFSFSLEVAKTDGVSEPKETDYEQVATVKNDNAGIFVFNTLKFAHKTDLDDKTVYDVGTYYYRIKEVLGTKDPAGYTYSQESYVIKVVVKDAPDGSDKLQVEATLNGRPYSKAVAETPIIFTNTYKASGSITLKGTKTLSGSSLVKDQFTFELLDQDQKTVLQTVKNAVDGSFTFQPLTYDQSLTAATGSAEKTYYVREIVTTAEKADGITYDSTLYKVTVTITDKGDGTLSTSSKIQTVSGTTTKDATAIKFANTFAGTASIIKTAEDGKTPLPGAEFELYAAKANGSGYDLYGRYTSDSNGKISVSGLPANSYYFVESKAPDGYLIPKDANGNPVKYSFIIGVNAGAGKVANAVADFSQTVVNGKGYGTVELTKYNTAETKTLAGAQFALYDSNGKQVAVRRNEDGNYTYSLTASENTETTLVTGKDGKITITGLMWGSYYFQETKAPDGYILSSDKISFKVDSTSFDAKGNPVTIKIKATNKATSITIEKVDEDGNALAGASMAIRDPQTRQIIESWTSTSEPHVIEGVLAAGKTYYLSEQQAPEGYEIAAEQEFTVPADGKITVTMTDKKSDGKEGSVTVTKKVSLVDEDANVIEAFVKDYTAYIGIFTDPAGEHPYGGDYLQAVQIHNGSSGSVSFTGLPKGTYYIFETDANGTPIAYDDFQIGDIGSFICTVEDGDATVNVKNRSDNSVTLNNVYYDFPDGFAYNGTINITKNVIKDGESADVDDTFYAGIFTKDENGKYVLLNDMVYELLQNDTITVDVPLGGENGAEPVTYYVLETDETGKPIDKDAFAYKVSGEGTVSLDKDNLEGAITIVNTVDEEEEITPTPTPSAPSDTTTTTTSGGTTAQVHESDSKRVIGVKTGDNTPIGAYAAVLVIAALAIAGGIYYKKKRKNDK